MTDQSEPSRDLEGLPPPMVLERRGDGSAQWGYTAEQVRSILAARQQAPEWMPIETAPKDGAPILGWNKEYGIRETKMNLYGEGSPGYAAWKAGNGPRESGWSWTEPVHNYGSSWKPTHWMPRPPAPGISAVPAPPAPQSGEEWMREAALQINRLILTAGAKCRDAEDSTVPADERITDADIDRMEATLLSHLRKRVSPDASKALSDEQEREAFERWGRINGFALCLDEHGNEHDDTGIAWEAWQARAALARLERSTPDAKALSDEQIIERCAAAGIGWITPDPDGDEDDLPGLFEASMDNMRRLLSASTPIQEEVK